MPPVNGCFPFNQNFRKCGLSGKWYRNFSSKYPEIPETVEFRNANHSTAKSRNSGSKVEWKDNFQEKIFENLGIPCEVVVFFGNFGKCCSIRYWKLPKIQTRRLVEWKAPNIYPFLMPHRTTVSTGRTLRHRLTMKVFQ